MDELARMHGGSDAAFGRAPWNDAFAKSTRSIVCRDALWQSLEQVAAELECTVDYLVNDAIKLYVRQRLTRRPSPLARPTPTGQFAPPLGPLPPPLPPPLRASPPVAVPLGATVRVPPPLPPPLARAPRLTVTYGAETKLVEERLFVIGRAKSSGLHIKDPNISRQHAMIELTGGVHYLVDAGSTNGTIVNGERIVRRAIADGDEALICDHVIRFSLTR